MANILVVDGDQTAAQTRAAFFERHGHDVQSARGTQGALQLMRDSRNRAEIIVIGQALSDGTGPQLCREVRASPVFGTVPLVIVIDREDVIDRVVAFEVGADDVVDRKCSMRELELRIRAVLRREPRARPQSGPHEIGVLQVDPEAHRALVRGEPVDLSALEFKLLSYLVSRKGRVQRREHLLAEVWHMENGASGRTVDACVKRLRAKLGDAEHYIHTVRGVGYLFSAEAR